MHEPLCSSFSPDGSLLAIGGSTIDRQSVLSVYDVGNGKRLQHITGLAEVISSVDLSRDNSMAVSSGWADTVRFWDVKTGKLIRALKAPKVIYSASMSPDETQIAGGIEENGAWIWDARNGRILRRLTFQDQSPSGFVSFLPDGKTIVTVSGDCTQRNWDSQTGKLLHTWSHKLSVADVSFSRDRSAFVGYSWTFDNARKQIASVAVYDSKSGQNIFRLNAMKSKAREATLSSDGKRLGLIGGTDSHSIVYVWDLQR